VNRLGRPVAAVIAVAFAAAVVTGRADLLVRPWFVWAFAATGALLGLVALRSRVDMSARAAAALMLPVAVGITLTPALASRGAQDAVLSAAPATRIGDGSNPLVQGSGGAVTLLQILQAEQQVGGVLLAGRPVQVDAIVAGPHLLERSVIVCCAADAQRIAVDEQGPVLSPAGHWVRVAGHLGAAGTQTLIVAASVTPIPTPADPFL
jgi:hypothetical protein